MYALMTSIILWSRHLAGRKTLSNANLVPFAVGTMQAAPTEKNPEVLSVLVKIHIDGSSKYTFSSGCCSLHNGTLSLSGFRAQRLKKLSPQFNPFDTFAKARVVPNCVLSQGYRVNFCLSDLVA